MTRPLYCQCADESPDPCPACGATVDGNDRVNGICQAQRSGRDPREWLPQLILVHRDTGERVT